MNFDKTDLRENTLIITNEDNSITCIPEEGCTLEEKALFNEFRTEYPDGKQVIPVEPQEPIPTEAEIQAELINNLILDNLNMQTQIDNLITSGLGGN